MVMAVMAETPLPKTSWLQSHSTQGWMVPAGLMIKSSEHDRDATVHEVRYDLENMVACVQIYQTPFDTGSMEQWHKF